MRLTPLLVPVSIAVMVFIGGIAIWKYSKKANYQAPAYIKTTAENDQKKVEDALLNNHPEEALKILEQYSNELGTNTPANKKWLNLSIETAVMLRDSEFLTHLYQLYPEAISANETASLYVGENLITRDQPQSFEQLRNIWKGKETFKVLWLVLDASLLEHQKRRPEAIELLKSTSFEGPTDTLRLVKLALLNYPDNPQASWEYLNTAAEKDPKNPDIRIYRAKLLESVGKQAFALSEYIDAVSLAPKNPILKDEVAEFFLRQQDYNDALVIWGETLQEVSTESIWVKFLFWSRVVKPIKVDFSKLTIPSGTLKPLIEYLINLPENIFWNSDEYEKISDSQKLLNTVQPTFWLRILQDLKSGEESKADDLLKYNPFRTTSWNPGLQLALRRILHDRKEGTLVIDDSTSEILLPQQITQETGQAIPPENLPFFNLLDKMAQIESGEKVELNEVGKKVIDATNKLIKSPVAFAAAFLAAGWNEAALNLLDTDTLPNDIPEWVSFGFTNAMRLNRGSEVALAFAKKQKPFSMLELLKAELYIDQKRFPDAIAILKPIISENGVNSGRASWLTSMIYLEEKNYEAAKAAINSSKELSESLAGKELNARIALSEGNEKQAIEIYQSIADSSPEARSFLARKAFADKDWDKARKLTEDLLKDYPVNLTLRQNLQKIIEEQAAVNQGKTAPAQPAQKPGN